MSLKGSNKKEYQRNYMREKRKQKSVTDVTQSVTQDPENVTQDVTQCPAIIHALTDPLKRRKLERITESLRNFNQLANVYYGCGKDSVPFDRVGELLEATQ